MEVRKIEPRAIYRKKHVAAYARVSTLKENQEDSFETQVNYYDRLIQAAPDWTLTKVYSDHGFSGVSAENRPGFMEMMQDGYRRAFDILLVRSISRFARNVKEAQIYCRELRVLGIEVRFERERISSTDPSAEMAFNLLASCAQEESRSISERTKWSIHKLQEQGIHHVGSKRFLGYDEIKGVLTPNEDQWMVAYMFERYAAGDGIPKIKAALEALGHTTTRASIGRILRNPVYVGDRHLQKEAPKNYLTHKPDWSQPFDSWYFTNMHEAIISRDLWCSVQTRLDEAKELRGMGVKPNADSHCLYGKLYCGACGTPMKRRTLPIRGKKVATWICDGRRTGRSGNGCQCRVVTEDALHQALCEQCRIGVEELETWVLGVGKVFLYGDTQGYLIEVLKKAA